MSKVMIVCLLFNRQPFTKLCLENLFNYTSEPFDLFLWDNGSEKPTLDLLDKLEGLKFVNGSTITVIRNKVNLGISDSEAKLQKFRKPGQHFMKLDNDVIVPKDSMWLTTLCEIMDNNTEGIKVVGYPMHDPKYFLHL
jgi:GT2 family glycosyltransferase